MEYGRELAGNYKDHLSEHIKIKIITGKWIFENRAVTSLNQDIK
ncbi:MAG TPA: hypothetical protein PK358_05935 [Spirochaetota bacterium]|nr:hypothetical protein [Spirochaetota bacterium]HPJ34356.1 hypothetical protein [Spirochaetota bacterium]